MRTIGLLALGLAATVWLHNYEKRRAVVPADPPKRLPLAEVIDFAGWKAARLQRGA